MQYNIKDFGDDIPMIEKRVSAWEHFRHQPMVASKAEQMRQSILKAENDLITKVLHINTGTTHIEEWLKVIRVEMRDSGERWFFFHERPILIMREPVTTTGENYINFSIRYHAFDYMGNSIDLN